MLFNANKKNKEDLKIINELIDRSEDIKASNEYGEWTFNDEITLQNAKIAKAQFEITIQSNRETYLKNIMLISKVVCASAIVGALAYNASNKNNKS